MSGGFSLWREFECPTCGKHHSGQVGPSIGACQVVIPRQSSTNFPWKFGVQWTTILWWKVFAKPGNWTQDLLIYAQMLYRWATRLGRIYKEQPSNMHCLCVRCLSGRPRGICVKTGIFSHVPLRVGSPAPAGDCHVYVGRCLVCS